MKNKYNRIASQTKSKAYAWNSINKSKKILVISLIAMIILVLLLANTNTDKNQDAHPSSPPDKAENPAETAPDYIYNRYDHRSVLEFDHSITAQLTKADDSSLFIPHNWSVFSENYFTEISLNESGNSYSIQVYSYLQDEADVSRLTQFDAKKNDNDFVYKLINNKEIIMGNGNVFIKDGISITDIKYSEIIRGEENIKTPKSFSQWETAKSIIYKNFID